MKKSELLAKLSTDVNTVITTIKNDFQTSTSDLNWKPDEKQWSVLECFQHLVLYNRYYLSELEKALSKADIVTEEDLRSTFMGKLSINMMRPENVKKQKTFKRMNPINSNLNRNVLMEFLQQQERIIDLLTKGKSLALNTAKIKIEFFKLLTMTAAEALEFIVVHQQRHVLQASRVLKNEDVKISLVV